MAAQPTGLLRPFLGGHFAHHQSITTIIKYKEVAVQFVESGMALDAMPELSLVCPLRRFHKPASSARETATTKTAATLIRVHSQREVGRFEVARSQPGSRSYGIKRTR